MLLVVFCNGMFGCRSPKKDLSGVLSAESTTAGEGILESPTSENVVSGSATQSSLSSETAITGEANSERTTYTATTTKETTNSDVSAKTTTSQKHGVHKRGPLFSTSSGGFESNAVGYVYPVVGLCILDG